MCNALIEYINLLVNKHILVKMDMKLKLSLLTRFDINEHKFRALNIKIIPLGYY
ncbi:MAG: hypothetical protein BWX56_01031 [Euryarchaeota archaeon ADurb.Bin023]|jgi:hypothetical protein|uniref:Uncharacterized protein n=1 Tax=Candidatus Methanofastidiosum methylothiophilum TaxID=1705564 RepID=A0A150JM41_9EURY|nr:MAG: hypothetical protein APG09_00353 [Candidatus Methanofastidiosum methylthiophilus]OQC51325.1 MAG: hypothetical protein BWX56_01031 [Euryarchaeota archaeon ADurb.Bin023]